MRVRVQLVIEADGDGPPVWLLTASAALATRGGSELGWLGLPDRLAPGRTAPGLSRCRSAAKSL
jgi:hypothetical protein